MFIGGKIKKSQICSARLSLHIFTLGAVLVNEAAITQSKKPGRQTKTSNGSVDFKTHVH